MDGLEFSTCFLFTHLTWIKPSNVWAWCGVLTLSFTLLNLTSWFKSLIILEVSTECLPCKCSLKDHSFIWTTLFTFSLILFLQNMSIPPYLFFTTPSTSSSPYISKATIQVSGNGRWHFAWKPLTPAAVSVLIKEVKKLKKGNVGLEGNEEDEEAAEVEMLLPVALSL